PYDASVEIDLMPLQRQDLARHPPAGDVGERDDPAERGRQLGPDGLELIAFEEARADVILRQQWDVWLGENLCCPAGERVGSLQGRQFSIDAGVRGVCCLPCRDVAIDVSRRDHGRPEVSKSRTEMLQKLLHSAQRRSLINMVVVQQIVEELTELDPVRARI